MKILRVLPVICLLGAVVAVSAQDEDYRVRYGDTLDVIAQEHDISLACLADANELTNANTLTFGQMLTIPADCEPYDPIEAVIISNMVNAAGDDEATDESGQGGGAAVGDYRVRYGDTLDVIAQDNNVSVACLIAANDLVNANDLSFNQMLTIPDDCSPYDSMESVILSNIDDLEAAGFTESDMGQGGGGGTASADSTEAAQEAAAMEAASTAPLNETYVVQSGDNLSKIAEQFGVTTTCLQRTNGIANPDLIYSGQTLLISAACQAGGGAAGGGFSANYQCFGDRNPGRVVNGGVYTVQQGDTLDFIGCDLNMNTTCLVALNNLSQKGGQIAIGQRLTIGSQCAGWVAP